MRGHLSRRIGKRGAQRPLQQQRHAARMAGLHQAARHGRLRAPPRYCLEAQHHQLPLVEARLRHCLLWDRRGH